MASEHTSEAEARDEPCLPVLRVAVGEIDATALDAAVRAMRDAPAPNGDARAVPDRQTMHVLRLAFDEIEARLAIASQRTASRHVLPRRLERFGRVAPLFLKPYNYVFRAHAEAIAEQTQALRAIVTILRAITGAYDER